MTAPRTEIPDLAPGHTWPGLDAFTVLARDRRVVPVVRRLIADGETPLGVYRKLADGAPGTFLLESAEHGGVWSRWSIIGAQSRATLTEQDGRATWVGEPPVGVPTDGDPTIAPRVHTATFAPRSRQPSSHSVSSSSSNGRPASQAMSSSLALTTSLRATRRSTSASVASRSGMSDGRTFGS